MEVDGDILIQTFCYKSFFCLYYFYVIFHFLFSFHLFSLFLLYNRKSLVSMKNSRILRFASRTGDWDVGGVLFPSTESFSRCVCALFFVVYSLFSLIFVILIILAIMCFILCVYVLTFYCYVLKVFLSSLYVLFLCYLQLIRIVECVRSVVSSLLFSNTYYVVLCVSYFYLVVSVLLWKGMARRGRRGVWEPRILWAHCCFWLFLSFPYLVPGRGMEPSITIPFAGAVFLLSWRIGHAHFFPSLGR